ncbi:extracellular solute-binding protein [Rhodoferax aquaticus]|uniref:Extracellular solute-binding protein n=1 Tax=Rhodoferax aquaticus TaxID=2527691 RepID=A0A515ER86_9BURK|nr:extracellular solute-binding protein [Rhodoferax aquaticus]QDL55181.1 extracellular solute-binding protein [Rhodoferax aquaticus]
MQQRRAILVAALVAGSLLSAAAHAEKTLSALFMAQAAYSEDDVRAMTSDFEKANPGVKVKLEFVPYDALHDKIVAAHGAGSGGYDVVLFDVVWPAEFASKGFLQDVTKRIAVGDIPKVFPGAWTTVSYKDKFYGMPWILDTKFLFYNTEMLKKAGISAPPKTWGELEKQAKIIKDKGIVKYPVVWSWAQKEAMICDYTTLSVSYGGKFFTDGKPSFHLGGSLEAVQYMKASIDAGLSNPNSREYEEEDVRKVFSNGDAAFALNWGYMYNMAKDPKESKVVGKVGIVSAPGVDGKTVASAVNGSMGLGITAKSANPEEAWKFIAHMSAPATQEKYAKLSLPIWKASFSKPAVKQGQEDYVNAAAKSLEVMAARPETPVYQELSSILQKNLHSVLLGKAKPDAAMKLASDAAAKLK